jgi:4-hydroxy-tetrahydrodipicolinate reductase
MGRAVTRAVMEADGVTLAAAFTQDGAPTLGQDIGTASGVAVAGVEITPFSADGLAGCDALIDFSRPEATRTAVLAMQVSPCQALVTGTTGQSEAELTELKDLARGLRFLRAGNFSLGVNLMEALVERAAKALGPDYDVEIDEAHHRHKVDSPSGTAILLGEAAARGRNIDFDPVLDRKGERAPGSIGMSVRRAGGIVGDHAVSFTAELEQLTLCHRALDRSVFAHGAVTAARWLVGQQPGLYGMADVLGL